MFQAIRVNFSPFLAWWPEVNRRTLKADAIAGVTGAIVVLPQGIAFASIAGLPPEFGLYAAMVPAVIAALFGSSRHMISGPTTPASIVLFSSLSALAEPGSADYIRYALTLTFMVGVIEFAMGLARLGLLVNFISHSVIVGFTAGAAILIATSQLENFFGVEISPELHVFEVWIYFGRHLDEVRPLATAVGVLTIVIGLLARRYYPRVPYMITAMLGGSLVAWLLNALFDTGDGEGTGIILIGAVPTTLPPLSFPDFSFGTLQQLAPAALAVTLFALAEAVSISRALAARSGQYIDGSQEFIGQGLSNIVGSFFSSYVATGSFNRSGLNYEAGAQTPLAAIFAGGLLVVVVIAVAPLLAYFPNAALAALLFVVAWGLIDFEHIRKTTRTSRSEGAVLWVTFLATLLLKLEFAILLGVLLSLVVFLRQSSRPRVLVRAPDHRLPKHRFNTDPDLPECPQFKIVRIDGAIFFGAVNYVAERLRVIAKRNPEQKHLLILARSINFVDVAGAELLAREARQRRAMGGALYLHQVKDEARGPLRRGGYLDEIGEENLFQTKGDAIATVFERLDRSVCRRCRTRIFSECQAVAAPEAEADGPGSDR